MAEESLLHGKGGKREEGRVGVGGRRILRFVQSVIGPMLEQLGGGEGAGNKKKGEAQMQRMGVCCYVHLV